MGWTGGLWLWKPEMKGTQCQRRSHTVRVCLCWRWPFTSHSAPKSHCNSIPELFPLLLMDSASQSYHQVLSCHSALIIMLLLLLNSFSCVRLFATPWTAAYQASLSMGFSRPWLWWYVIWKSVPSLTYILPPISTGISTKILAEAYPNSFGTYITHPQRIREQWWQTINIIAETESWLYPRQKMSLSEERILTTHSDNCMHSWIQLQGQ